MYWESYLERVHEQIECQRGVGRRWRQEAPCVQRVPFCHSSSSAALVRVLLRVLRVLWVLLVLILGSKVASSAF
jgi:hypothetical protein